MSLLKALNPKTSAVRVEWDIKTTQLSDTDIILVKNSVDLVKDFTYLDENTDDQRIDKIKYSSESEWKEFTDTFEYWWGTWNYYVTKITTS